MCKVQGALSVGLGSVGVWGPTCGVGSGPSGVRVRVRGQRGHGTGVQSKNQSVTLTALSALSAARRNKHFSDRKVSTYQRLIKHWIDSIATFCCDVRMPYTIQFLSQQADICGLFLTKFESCCMLFDGV